MNLPHLFSTLGRFNCCFALFWLGLASAALRATPAAGGLSIDKEPVRIERKTFNPDHPPADMPTHTALEAGLCEYRFGCETRSEATQSRSWVKTLPAKISALQLKLQLQIVIWTIENAPQKIVDHEEAHRSIAEHYFAHAEIVAHRLGEAALGRKLNVPGHDKNQALEEALHQLQNEIVEKYSQETAHRCTFAQERFDAITDHSRNSIPEKVAVAQALQEEENHYNESPSPLQAASPGGPTRVTGPR